MTLKSPTKISLDVKEGPIEQRRIERFNVRGWIRLDGRSVLYER